MSYNYEANQEETKENTFKATKYKKRLKTLNQTCKELGITYIN